jgi:hypothetical protein
VTGPGDAEGASGLPRTGAKAQQRHKLQARPQDESADSSTGSWPRPGLSPLRPPDDGYPEPADYDQPQYDQAQYDKPQYDAPGYEQQQYDAPRYEQAQYDSYPAPEYEPRPYEQTGSFPRPGYERPQYGQDQYGQDQYEQNPYDQNQHDYDQNQYDQNPYEQTPGEQRQPNRTPNRRPERPMEPPDRPGPRQAGREPYQPEQFDTEHYDEEDLPRVRTGRRASPVRPYVRTGGRTRSNRELALETLVSVSRGRPRSARPPNREYRRVVDLCDVPRSIAEVAALTSVPVGVARVLVGDLAAQGLLTVHQTRGPSGVATDMALMQRVLAGLRKL